MAMSSGIINIVNSGIVPIIITDFVLRLVAMYKYQFVAPLATVGVTCCPLTVTFH
jgi:hypothetical protein